MKLEIIEKRQIKEDKSSNNKLRVAAYVRVSSKHDDQLDSFESQVKYFHEKIITNPDWDFVRIYSDEGISRTNTQHRKGFNEMVEDAVNGKFDLLLTKSISRFARNTLDTLKYVRTLKDSNVAILFEKEYILNGGNA
jgi:DNA invertase Pin-like site-specific DNA recombinase